MTIPSKHLNSRGMALVLTLSVLVIITAMVVEFAYGVYINTSFLYNWKASERLSLIAKSGVTLASRFVTDVVGDLSYTYPSYVEMPASTPFNVEEGIDEGKVAMRIEDENAKFNMNTVVYPNGLLNEKAYQSFKRLLRAVDVDEELADRLSDWIDPDEAARTEGSEKEVKNAPLESVDELLHIPGVKREDYDKLYPYVTIYGSGLININGADVPVIMSLDDTIDEDMARRIIEHRDLKPFKSKGEVNNVAGFEKLLSLPISVKADAFKVLSVAATEDGIKRSIECVLDAGGKVLYWREI